MSFYLAKTGKNNWQGKFSSFPAEIAVHGISTRWGGKSSAPFASMRGRGRLEVAEVRGQTKKGRTGVLLKRYL